MKKSVSMLLALLMVFALALPLTGTADTTIPYEGDPITISYMGIDFRTADRTFDKIVDQKLAELIAERIGNVVIEQFLVAESDYGDKINVAFSADDLADITAVYSTPQEIANKYGDYGVTLNYADYLDYLPNYVEDAEKFNLVYGKTEDGQIVALCPDISHYDIFTWGGTANTYFNTAMGLTTPATTDELLANLRAIKEADPECASPYITFPGNCLLSGLNTMFIGTHYDSVREDKADVVYDWNNTKQWYYPVFTDAFKAEVEFARTLYTEGLVAADYMTQTWDKFVKTLYTADDWYYLGYWNIFGADNVNQMREEFPDFSYVSCPAIASEFLPNGSIVPTATIGSTKGAVVTRAGCEEPELVCSLIDLLHSEEVAMLLGWGIEGETYVLRDEPSAMMDAMYDFAPDLAVGVNKATGTVNPLAEYGLCYDDYRHQYSYVAGHKNNETYKAQMLSEQDHPEKTDYVNAMFAFAAENPGAVVQVESTPAVTADEGEEIAKIMTDANTIYAQNIMLFVKGERSMDEWDDFMADLQATGIDRVIEIYNSKEMVSKLAQ